LLKAIAQAGVSAEWGDAPFLPRSADDLSEAAGKSWLFLCDEQASYGELPELEAVCRKLGLSYSRHSEASFDADAELADWRPGMKKALVRHGSNLNSVDTFVSTESFRHVIELLEAGHAGKALRALRKFCFSVPELPALELI
jgi:hypothetical protein